MRRYVLKIRVKKQTTMTIISNTRLKSPMEQKLGLHVLSFFLPSFVRRDVSLSTNPGVSHTMNTVVNCYCPINVTLYNLVICEFLMVFLFYAHVCSTQSDLTMIHLELNKLTRCKGRESSTHAYGRVLTLLDI